MDVIHNIVGQLFDWIQSLGYFGIMLGLMLEVIPVSYTHLTLPTICSV